METNSDIRPPTVKDVAKAAGVTPATVSNVLRGKFSEVSEATAKVVLHKVDQLGYVRNLTASSLSSKKSNCVALIMIGVFDPGKSKAEMEPNPFYGELAMRIEREAREKGYALNIYAGGEDGYEEFVLQRNIDAAILCGVTPKENPRILQRRGSRFILFDSYTEHVTHMMVRTNEKKGGALAAQHILAKGRTKPVFIGPPLSHDPNNIPAHRFYGARSACEEAGIQLKHVETWTHLQEGVDTGKKLASMDIDAAIVSSDIVAAGIIQGLLSSGKKVPEDVAVIGYDNLPFCKMVFPALTTIDQGLQMKVEQSIDLMMNGHPGENRIIEPVLIEREST